MMKEKILTFLDNFFKAFVAYILADRISNCFLHTDKWYVSFVIFLLVCLLISLIEAGFKNSKAEKIAGKRFKSVDEITEDVLAEIRELKASGAEVQAVKKVREVAEADLLEAKQFVDGL